MYVCACSNVCMCLRGRRNDTTVIPLEYAVVQRGHGSSGGGQFTFIVYHADDRSSSYHFSQFLACSTEEERDEWMHALGSCSTHELHTDREESATSALRAAEEMEAVHVQLAAEQEQKKRIVEMLEAQAELGRALTVRHELLMMVVVTRIYMSAVGIDLSICSVENSRDLGCERLVLRAYVSKVYLPCAHAYVVLSLCFAVVPFFSHALTHPSSSSVIFPVLHVTGGARNADTASHENRRKCHSTCSRLGDASECSDQWHYDRRNTIDVFQQHATNQRKWHGLRICSIRTTSTAAVIVFSIPSTCRLARSRRSVVSVLA